MKKTLMLIFLCACAMAGTAQPREIALKFVESFLNEKVSTDVIVATLLNVTTTDKDKIMLIKWHLEEARKELRSKKVKLENVRIVSYGEIPEHERSIVTDQDQKEIGNIYFVYYTDKEFIPLLIRSDKVLAFATLDKGGRKYLMEY